MIWAKVGSRLLALASLVILGFWLPARVYNGYDIRGLGLWLGYDIVVAVILISPSVLIVTLLARRQLPRYGASSAAYMVLAYVGFAWMLMALPASLMLGL